MNCLRVAGFGISPLMSICNLLRRSVCPERADFEINLALEFLPVFCRKAVNERTDCLKLAVCKRHFR